jgi:serine/threonine protein kinase
VSDETVPLGPRGDRLGAYQLVQELGQGGMGVVHLALDSNGRAVAIKVLRDHVAHDRDARARLAREVQTLERVSHPNVAPVLDADVDGPRPYIVTRYVPGPSLDRWVAEHGPISGDALVRLGRGLSQALQAIHAAGVVHRDLKPGNVLLVDDQPVVIDFGIAHVADDARLTSTGLVMGTPGYLSPEVLDGGAVTEATDWWGWAATLLFAATGRPPFGRGPIDAVIHRVQRGESDMTGIDPRLAPLLRAALAPEASARPNRERILAALEEYARGGDTTQMLPTSNAYGAGNSPVPIGVPIQPQTIPAQIPAQISPTPTVPTPSDVPVVPVVASTHAFAAQPVPQTRSLPTGAMPDERPAAYVSFTQAPVSPPSGPSYPIPAAPIAANGSTYPTGGSTYPQPTVQPQPYANVGQPPAYVAQPQAPAGPAAQAAPYGQPTPAPGSLTDPRIGRGSRTGTLLALLAVLAGVATGFPLIALLAFIAWSTLARMADKSVTSVTLKRLERGRRSSDIPLAVLVAPLHLIGAVVSAIAAALIPVLLGIIAAFGAAWAQASLTGLDPNVMRPVPLATASVVTSLLCWWGVGGTSFRRGSRSLVRGLAPGHVGAVVAVILLVVATGYLGLRTQSRGFQPQWWPVSARTITSLPIPF